MINPQIFTFLRNLKENNYREWFHENKPVYSECRENFSHFLELLIHEVSKFDKSVAGLQPKDCIFRINRDIRFSKDKSPYKTNIGAFIAPGGRNKGKAGYYVHLEPDNSFVAGGIYMPPSPVLKAIRTEIFNHFDEFETIVSNKNFVRHFNAIDADKLKTKPKDFPADFIGLEYLKFKHYTVAKKVSEKEVTGDKFLTETLEAFKVLFAMNRFINNSIDNM